MPESFDAEPAKGILDSILERIPGFSGYNDREARRKSDQQARLLIADHLQRGKRSLDAVTGALVDKGAIDTLPKFDRLRGRFDLVIAKLRGAPSGYQSFFELDDVTDDLLEDIYEHDLWTIDDAEALANTIESLVTDSRSAEEILAQVTEHFDHFETKIKQREKLFAGAKEMY